MIKKKKIIYILLIVMLVGWLVPFGLGCYLVRHTPEKLASLSKYGIALNYSELKADFCFMCVKLSAKKTKFIAMNNSINLGEVFVKVPIWNYKKVYFESFPLDEKNSLKMSGVYRSGIVNVENLELSLGSLKASLAGNIDIANRNVNLKGIAKNLFDFIKGYVPKNIQPLLSFMIKNKPQPVEIDAHKKFLRVNKIPFLPLR